MVPVMITAFAFSLYSTCAFAKCDGATCKTVPAAAPTQSEPGSSLFQHGTGRSFVVTARAGAGSKSQMSEPRSSLLLGDTDAEDDEDGFITGMGFKKPTPAADSADVNDPAFYLGVCLDILVFLIILDGVRRYCGAPKQTAQPEASPHTGGLSRALMTQQPKCTGSQLAKDAAAAAAKLHEAVRAGDVSNCTAILNDADPYLTRRILSEADVWGCTALHLAADKGSDEIVDLLLKRGGSTVKVNAVDAWDQTPLHFAARAGSVAVCRSLLDRGALVDSADAQELTALHVAAKLGHEATCEFLLERGGGLRSTSDADIPPMLSALLVKRMFQQK
jgi:hypothetical protein